jgi:Ca-activated chloride channel family protein
MISDGKIIARAHRKLQKKQKLGIKIITIGVGTEKGGTIPLKEWCCRRF